MRALRDGGLVAPTDHNPQPSSSKRPSSHNPKAASISTISSSSAAHTFVPISSLGPPSPSSNAYVTKLRRTNAVHHPPALAAASNLSASASAPAQPQPDQVRSELDFSQSFPSIDELEAAFPSVPSAISATASNAFIPSSNTPRSSRSQSAASATRFAYQPSSSSSSPAFDHAVALPSTSRPSSSGANIALSTTSASSPSNPTNGARIHKPELPRSQILIPKHMKQLLDSTFKVLILDVRTRADFDCRHLRSGAGDPIICVVTSATIENALSVLFRNRNKFDNVPGGPIARLIRAIYDDESPHKRLKVAPYVLQGGLTAWEEEFKQDGVVGTEIVSPNSTTASAQPKPRMPPPEVPRHTKPPLPSSTNPDLTIMAPDRVGPAVSIQRPSPDPSSASRPASMPPPAIPSMSPPVIPPPITNTMPFGTGSAVLPSQVQAQPLANGHMYSQRSAQQSRESNGSHVPESPTRSIRRKPTDIARPPSAGPMSAYRRSIADVHLSSPTSPGSPIQYPTPIRAFSPNAYHNPSQSTSSLASNSTIGDNVQAPPVASLNNSPLARRRSDYIEQSQPLPAYAGGSSNAGPAGPGAASSSRAAIDYPQLAFPHLIRPPPPAAAPLQRQDQRPLGPQMTGQNSGNATGGAQPPKPPLIASDYPVSSWSDMQVATSGLKNLGNTCYMNSTVQCLSATIPFARFFTEGRWKGAVNAINPLGTKGQLAGAFAKLLHEMWHGELPYRSPHAFRTSVCVFSKQFANSDQHDSQEFLSTLMDGLHEDLNRILTKPVVPMVTPAREAELETLPTQIAGEQEWQIYQMRNDSIVVDYFQGQFRNRVTCQTCYKTSTTYNSFMYLSLPIPTGRTVSLKECLDHFTREETLDKDNAWNCPNCKCPRKATTQMTISRLPPVLLIHLKRFSVKGPFTDKLETVVDFPTRGLDLTNYMPPPLPPSVARPARPGPPLRADDPRMQVPPYRYDLYGVTNHYGTLTGGHYTAFIASRGGWLHCDDSRITEANPNQLTSRAYVLFYRRSM
ncbi:cysteine proteinase [Auriculariales sp. MPI-PUGE-AT-0066]|nr:cysteine proteinase [Auriculariales sp. MPI-PUGE-AT-0066]